MSGWTIRSAIAATAIVVFVVGFWFGLIAFHLRLEKSIEKDFSNDPR